ncbi:MAG: [FeFe] hydrogenase H-cluster radical SAM maturase HydE [Eubacterium sp.]
MKALIEKLETQRTLSKEEIIFLLDHFTPELSNFLFDKARKTAYHFYGNHIYTRGLIEFSNFCKNDCYYCGIRKSNHHAERYRLTLDNILFCCDEGYRLGFRTFVLQSGEDPFFNESRMVEIIESIHFKYPDCAITLSIGERSENAYQHFFNAGANRFLLRHETANADHYNRLHPDSLSLKHRKNCLETLKSIGYQIGTGFMVGSPYQKTEYLAEDLLYIAKLKPQMIGIGPYIPQKDTPFADQKQGRFDLTLFLIGLLRLMNPNALIPATTALGTIDIDGREKGILAGANVVMPNLSPLNVRKKYSLYDNKICTGDEAAECRISLEHRMHKIGYELVTNRGDCVTF